MSVRSLMSADTLILERPTGSASPARSSNSAPTTISEDNDRSRDSDCLYIAEPPHEFRSFSSDSTPSINDRSRASTPRRVQFRDFNEDASAPFEFNENDRNEINFVNFGDFCLRKYQPSTTELRTPSLQGNINTPPINQLKLASVKRRVFAQIMDISCILLFWIYVGIICPENEKFKDVSLMEMPFDFPLVMEFLYETFFSLSFSKIAIAIMIELLWIASRLGSPGKHSMKLEILRVTNCTKTGPDSVTAQLVETPTIDILLLRLFYKYLFQIFLPVTLFNLAMGHQRTFHDYLTDTIVVCK